MGWQESIQLEHHISRIITQQQINGWQFDVDKATNHVEWLGDTLDGIYADVRPDLYYERETKYALVKTPFKADGAYRQNVQRYWDNEVGIVNGPYTPVQYIEPNLGSREKLMRQLSRFGWKPQSYTEKGNPQLTEESLCQMENPIGSKIAKWSILRHRKSQIEGWLREVRPDGRIEAQAVTCGTPTGRMRHRVVVNVPQANTGENGLLYYPNGSVVFGTEMRELFITREGFVLVGYDAKGLELRMLAHFMNDPEFAHAVVYGDPHQHTADKVGIPRKVAKTFMYALIYGAGDEKLGSITGGGAKEGKENKAMFMSGLPKLSNLIKRVKSAAQKGRIKGLDGRFMPVRSDHAALNLAIQGGGSIYMKHTIWLVDKHLNQLGLNLKDVFKVGDFHDESQSEVRDDENIIELFKDSVVKSFQEANELLKLRVPMDVDIRVGSNWAETH